MLKRKLMRLKKSELLRICRRFKIACKSTDLNRTLVNKIAACCGHKYGSKTKKKQLDAYLSRKLNLKKKPVRRRRKASKKKVSSKKKVGAKRKASTKRKSSKRKGRKKVIFSAKGKTVADLNKILKRRGLPQTGKKDTKISRIRRDMSKNK